MRLDEWQKWLDSQFLDSTGAKADGETTPQAPPGPQPPPETPLPQAPAAAPAQATVQAAVQAAPSRQGGSPEPQVRPAAPPPPPRTPAPAVGPGAPPDEAAARVPTGDELEVPSIDRYLPHFRSTRALEAAVVLPAAESAAPQADDEAPSIEPPAADEAGEAGVEQQPASARPPVEAVAPADATAEVSPAAPAGHDAPNEDAEDLRPTPDGAEQEPGAGARPRYGISHRRARHARNVRPEDAAAGMDDPSMWSLVPRHIQALLAMGNEETAQSSYRREFRESRVELIRRLLDPTLSLEETARILNVCPTTVRRYTNRGILTHQRTVGDQRRFKLSDVLAFLEAQSQARK